MTDDPVLRAAIVRSLLRKILDVLPDLQRALEINDDRAAFFTAEQVRETMCEAFETIECSTGVPPIPDTVRALASSLTLDTDPADCEAAASYFDSVKPATCQCIGKCDPCFYMDLASESLRVFAYDLSHPIIVTISTGCETA